MLKTEWVLRARYNLSREQIAFRFAAVCGQSGLTVASERAVLAALDAYAAGGDFADLLHFALASELGAAVFLTFDRTFARPEMPGPELEII